MSYPTYATYVDGMDGHRTDDDGTDNETDGQRKDGQMKDDDGTDNGMEGRREDDDGDSGTDTTGRTDRGRTTTTVRAIRRADGRRRRDGHDRLKTKQSYN